MMRRGPKVNGKAPAPLKIEALKDIETEKVYKNSNDHVIPSHPLRCIYQV
jgi:hypothetical protein